MTDKAFDLQQLISLSKTMLEKSQEESWDDVIVLEEKRSELIRLFFLEPNQHKTDIAESIQSIIAMDQDIMVLGRLRMFDLMQSLKEMDYGKKAVKAYTS